MESFNPTSGIQRDLINYVSSLDTTQPAEVLCPKLHMMTQLVGRIIAANGQLEAESKASIEILKQKISDITSPETTTTSKIARAFFTASLETTQMMAQARILTESIQVLERTQNGIQFSDKALARHFIGVEMSDDAIHIIKNSPTLTSSDRAELYESSNSKVIEALKQKDHEELQVLLQNGNVDEVSSFLAKRPESIRKEFILNIVEKSAAPDKDLVHYFISIGSVRDAIDLIISSSDLSPDDRALLYSLDVVKQQDSSDLSILFQKGDGGEISSFLKKRPPSIQLELFAEVITTLPKDQNIPNLLKLISKETYNVLLEESKNENANIPQELRVSLHNMLEAQNSSPVTTPPKKSSGFFSFFQGILSLFSVESKEKPHPPPKLTADELAKRSSEVILPPKEDVETISETTSFSEGPDTIDEVVVEAPPPVTEAVGSTSTPTTLDEFTESIGKELKAKAQKHLDEALKMQEKMQAKGKGLETAQAVADSARNLVNKAAENGKTLGNLLKALVGNQKVEIKKEENGSYTITLPHSVITKPTAMGVAAISGVANPSFAEKLAFGANAAALSIEIPKSLNFSLSIDSTGSTQRVELTFNDPKAAIFAKLPVVGMKGVRKMSCLISSDQKEIRTSASTRSLDKANPAIWQAKPPNLNGKEAKKTDPLEVREKVIPFLEDIWKSPSLKKKQG